MFPALFRRELVRQLARFGSQPAAGCFFRVVEFLWRVALRLFHSGFNLQLTAVVVNRMIYHFKGKLNFPFPAVVAAGELI